MVTVVKRPTGHKIIDQAIEAAITDSGGDALITFPYHGLGTGDTIYITSDIDEYNGFWYVTGIDSNTFKISEYAGGPFVEYYQDLTIDFYQTNPHDWNSVFLPIVYKCSNDRWPVNTIDTSRTISSFIDDNGYTDITASGIIKTSITALEFVKISNTNDVNLDGVWQVVERITSSRVVIDLPYDAANNLVGATIQYYYNNYQVNVRIYAGLPGSHPWTLKKPYEVIAELSLTPDEDGIVMFSVADYVKSKVSIKNNTTLFSLPLNLDAFTGFFIETAENYDLSDGYSLYRTEGEFTEDTFEGYAVAGKLPFKNVYSGDYADYVYTDVSPAMWLTLMDRLLAVEDKYFDISFIKNIVGAFALTINKYVSDYLTTVETIDFTDQGIGVYRIPITPDSAYDSFCVYVSSIATPGVPGETTNISLPAFSLATNLAGPDTDWTTGASPTVSITATSLFEEVQSDILVQTFAFTEGNTYTILVEVGHVNDTACDLILVVLDSGNNILESDTTILPSGTDTATRSFSFVAPAAAVKYGFYYHFVNGLGSNTNVVTLSDDGPSTQTTPDIPAVLGAQITEEICIDILESCEAQGGFIPTDIRLLEDGSYRLLE